MNLARIAFGIGSAIGARRLVQGVQEFGFDDLLAPVGLERRRSALDKVLPAIGYVGLGTVIGAGAALLLAPSSGRELRQRVSSQLDEAKTRMNKELRSMEGAAHKVQEEMRRNNGGTV